MYTGAVLAGGRSRRFGEDKALYVYRGKPLLLWVLESLEGAQERFIVANRPYPGFGVEVYPDAIPGGDSLSGLYTALLHAKTPWVAVAACDLPFLTPGYWGFLYEKALASPYPVVAALGEEGHMETLAAFYHRDLLPFLEAQLRAGDLFLGRAAGVYGATRVPFPELASRFGEELFVNANRKEELP